MLDSQKIRGLVETIESALPPSVGNLRAEAKANLRASLTAKLKDMGLVTYEEFKVQQALLARLRAQVETLQGRVEALQSGENSEESSS